MEDDFLILTEKEKIFVLQIFQNFAIAKSKYQKNPSFAQRTCIDILDTKFIQKHEKKIYFRNLCKKSVLKKHHIFGYRMYIKSEYLEQIYILAEANEWELLKQLSSVWINN